jgi:hypothetical protein
VRRASFLYQSCETAVNRRLGATGEIRVGVARLSHGVHTGGDLHQQGTKEKGPPRSGRPLCLAEAPGASARTLAYGFICMKKPSEVDPVIKLTDPPEPKSTVPVVKPTTLTRSFCVPVAWLLIATASALWLAVSP